MRTLTADNGTEFHDCAAIERINAARFYFATPPIMPGSAGAEWPD